MERKGMGMRKGITSVNDERRREGKELKSGEERNKNEKRNNWHINDGRRRKVKG
jgi:hypothetical protein